MIESITIQNFKSIKDLRLDLRPVNILIGPNGAGKSNFVGFFSFVHAIYDGQLGNYTAEKGGAGRLIYLGNKFSKQLSGELKFSDKNHYVVDIGITERDSFYFRREMYKSDPGDFVEGDLPIIVGIKSDGHEESMFESDEFKKNWKAENSIGSFRVYHFHDTSKNAPLKQTARIADTRFLRPDGTNLAAFLYELQQNHEQSFNRIEATIKMIAPYFERFDLQPNGDYIQLNWRQKGTDMYLNAADLSDGTLRFIALCTLLIQPNLPQTLLIDEPELGLHPYAISLLAGLMRSISLKTQLIVSTQSVELVNQFSPEDIIVVEQRNNESIFKRHTEAELADWLADYSLGDLWQKNLIGGNP